MTKGKQISNIALTKTLQFLLNISICTLSVTDIALHQTLLRDDLAREGLAYGKYCGLSWSRHTPSICSGCSMVRGASSGITLWHFVLRFKQILLLTTVETMKTHTTQREFTSYVVINEAWHAKEKRLVWSKSSMLLEIVTLVEFGDILMFMV